MGDEILERMRADPSHRWDRRILASIRLVANLRGLPAASTDPTAPRLSPTEAQNLQLLAYGLDCRMVADLRSVSHSTVLDQVKAARRKLGAKNLTHAVALAIRTGVIR